MKKSSGRPHKLPHEVRKSIVEAVVAKEVTYRQLAAKYQVSPGAVAICVKEFKESGIKKSNLPKWAEEQTKSEREKTIEREKLALKAELGDLYLQVKVLKKAESYIQWLKSESSS